MSNNQLSKTQALKLLTPVVDGEASEAERKAFMDFIAQNKDVRNRFKSVKNLKRLVSERSPRTKAPASLRNKVQHFINEVEEEDSDSPIDPPIYDIPCNGPGSHTPNINPPANRTTGYKSRYWLFSTAATMMVVIVLAGCLNISSESEGLSTLGMEEFDMEENEHFAFSNQEGDRLVSLVNSSPTAE